MVESWLPGACVVKHGSPKNYNNNHNQAKSKFSPDEVRCRFKPIGSVNWLKFRAKLNAGKQPEATWKEKLNVLWPDNGQNVEYQSATATFSEERTLLIKFKNIYGKWPLLNIFGPHSLGSKLTTQEVMTWLKNEMEKMDRIPSEDNIRQLAFEKWLERGCPQGDDWVDWFDAEQHLWENIILET